MTLASLFDPLPWSPQICPCLVPTKLVLQIAFRIGCDWDQVLPNDLQKDVRRWISNLDAVRDLKIP